MKTKLNNQKGFTIIEVLIVLAIAGLIMLIVFLAVPALQRNSRNTTRNSEASRINALVTECMANRNGVVASCDTAADIGYVAADFNQLTTVNTPTTSGATTALTANDQVTFGYTRVCTSDASNSTAVGATARTFVVMFRTETSGSFANRCIGG